MVYVNGKGILVREPSAVARHKKTKEVLAVGTAAKRMVGRTPQTIESVRPLKDGVIADFDATAAMLTHYVRRVQTSGRLIPKIPRPRVIIGIPSGVTEVERRAVADAAIAAGARAAYLVEEPMAAAIGAGLNVEDAKGNFIVDIGGGTTEIAIISFGGIVLGRSIRTAGDEMDEAIVNYFRLKYALLLGQPTAENLKIQIGTLLPEAKDQSRRVEEKFAVVRGRDLETGLPKSMKVSDYEVREALAPVIQEIVVHIKGTLEEAPPELVSDIMQDGIVMAGGGSLIPGIDKVVAEATKTKVIIAEDALSCVARGCGMLLTNPRLLSRVNITAGLK